MRRHIVLVGLPGAGKSVVGAGAAARLHAPFIDGDRAIEQSTGHTVARIFTDDGEPAFRALERQAIRAALAGPAAVIAPGGGWAAQPGNLDDAPHALIVHLVVPPDVALGRLGGRARPLLRDDPAGVMGRLHSERLPLYRLAGADIDTAGRSVPQVVDLVVRLARSQGGW